MLSQAGENAPPSVQGGPIAIRQPSIEQFTQAIAAAVGGSYNAGVCTATVLVLIHSFFNLTNSVWRIREPPVIAEAWYQKTNPAKP